jgi:hypothetical protein
VNFDLKPYVGAGPIRLGMPISQVRSLLGDPTPFRKSSESRTPADAFDRVGIHVHYDEAGTAEAIEFMTPCNPTLEQEVILGRPFSELLQWIARMDPEVQTDEGGLTSLRLGIGFYADGVNKISSIPVEGVIVFRKGYYD